MRILLDGVFSHTGSDSIYFNRERRYPVDGAYNSPNSPYAEWYHFRSWPNDYGSWWGFPTLPEVEELSPAFMEYINGAEGIVSRWLQAGADGWRLDVADELPMNFIREMRSRLKKEKNDAALIGEVWEDPSNKITYGEMRCYCLGDTLDSTMNYPLRDAIVGFMCCRFGAEEFVRRVDSLRENQPQNFFYAEMNLLGSHDKPRAINVLADIGDMEPSREYRRPFRMEEADYQRGRRRYIAAWELICAMPGIPCLYYGDEAGVTGMADPYCRGTYPWGKEDKRLQEAVR
jgi:glycosidase